MKYPVVSRHALIVGFVVVGLCAWAIIGGIVLIESILIPTPMPRLLVPGQTPSAPPVTRVALQATTAAPSATPLVAPTPIPVTVTATTPAPAPTLPATDAPPSAAPTSGPTAPPLTVNGCPVPAGWEVYTIEEGDTLFGFVLGSKNQISVEEIINKNCLKSRLIGVGQVIYLPPGVAKESPKVEGDGNSSSSAPAVAAGGGVPDKLTRTAKCPCTITMRPGLRLEQIAEAIDDLPVGFRGVDFMAAVKTGTGVPDLAFLRNRPAGRSLEGFMYPGTYTIGSATTAAQFRDMLLKAFEANVSAQIQADSSARGMTFWQAVTLASIVQRESRTASEQKLVASVFHNRLKANKGLGATVTLQYAIGVPGNWWPRVRNVNIKSPYNTFLNQGLPPTPIGNPGLDAILAAVYPADTNYQYFSAKCGGGGNFYAATYEEFEKGLQCSK